MLYVQYVQYVQYGAQTLMVRVLEFVSGYADRNADKEHTRIATPPKPPNALPRNTATGKDGKRVKRSDVTFQIVTVIVT